MTRLRLVIRLWNYKWLIRHSLWKDLICHVIRSDISFLKNHFFRNSTFQFRYHFQLKKKVVFGFGISFVGQKEKQHFLLFSVLAKMKKVFQSYTNRLYLLNIPFRKKFCTRYKKNYFLHFLEIMKKFFKLNY